jgi:hypothetical protein
MSQQTLISCSMEAGPEITAPENRRLLVYGDHGNPEHDEMAMGWKDRLDGKWYYSPQGGLIDWRILWWMEVPEPKFDS